jgi:hypothetical protein
MNIASPDLFDRSQPGKSASRIGAERDVGPCFIRADDLVGKRCSPGTGHNRKLARSIQAPEANEVAATNCQADGLIRRFLQKVGPVRPLLPVGVASPSAEIRPWQVNPKTTRRPMCCASSASAN